MARTHKPTKCGNWWVSRINGQRVRLCPIAESFDDAFKVLHGLLAQESGQTTPNAAVGVTVAELADKFMDWLKANKPEAFKWYLNHLRAFVRRFGSKPAEKLGLLDVEQFGNEQAKKPVAYATKRKDGSGKPVVNEKRRRGSRHFILAVRRLFNWGTDYDVIVRNPSAVSDSRKDSSVGGRRPPKSLTPFSELAILPCGRL